MIRTLIIAASMTLAQLGQHPPSDQPDPYKDYVNPQTSQSCCGGGDCKPISGDLVIEGPDYYQYAGMRIAKDQAQPSFDGRWHVCIVGSPPQLRCLLVPMNT